MAALYQELLHPIRIGDKNFNTIIMCELLYTIILGIGLYKIPYPPPPRKLFKKGGKKGRREEKEGKRKKRRKKEEKEEKRQMDKT